MNQIDFLTRMINESGMVDISSDDGTDERAVLLRKSVHRVDWPALIELIQRETGAGCREIGKACGHSETAINQFLYERAHYDGGDKAVDLILLYLLNVKGPIPRLGDANNK